MKRDFAILLARGIVARPVSTRVLGEWDKIEPYKARGFIAEWPAA